MPKNGTKDKIHNTHVHIDKALYEEAKSIGAKRNLTFTEVLTASLKRFIKEARRER